MEACKSINVFGYPLADMFVCKSVRPGVPNTRATTRSDLCEFGGSETFQNRAAKLWNIAPAELKVPPMLV